MVIFITYILYEKMSILSSENNNFFQKSFDKIKKGIDILILFCYNITVAWRDGRVGLRRTTGNRVYPNRYQGFESLSLRHIEEAPQKRCFFLCGRAEGSQTLIREANRVRIRAQRVSGVCVGIFRPLLCTSANLY